MLAEPTHFMYFAHEAIIIGDGLLKFRLQCLTLAAFSRAHVWYKRKFYRVSLYFTLQALPHRLDIFHCGH